MHQTCAKDIAQDVHDRSSVSPRRRAVLLAQDVEYASISANKVELLTEGDRSPRRTRQKQLTLFQDIRCVPLHHC